MPQDIAALRRQFARLDDAALDAFCLDHHPAVHDEFTRGLRKVALPGLARLALAMTEAAAPPSPATLEQAAAAYLRNALRLSADEAEADGRRFVRVLARRSGVFTRQGDEVGFIHPTFREYLAAWAVVRKSRHGDEVDLKQVWQRAVSRWADKRWREVALFALGLLSDAGQDVTTLVGRIWPGVLVVLPGGWPVFRPRRLGSAKALPFARAAEEMAKEKWEKGEHGSLWERPDGR